MSRAVTPPEEEWRLRPHGTPAAYRRHLRHGERPCESCRRAEALRKAEWDGRDEYNAARRERYAAARAAGLSSRDAMRAANRRQETAA